MLVCTTWEWLEIAAYIVAIFAAGASWWQYRRNSRRERMRWLYDLYQRFYDSREYQEVFDRIDYGETDFIRNGDRKLLPKLDCYLNFFEFVAILGRRKELREDEVKDMFQYPLERIAQDAHVPNYLRDNGYEQLDALLKRLRYPS